MGHEHIEIKLTREEVLYAAKAGVYRRINSLAKDYKDYYKDMKNQVHGAWSIDIDGALAELAAAKWLGCYWGGHVDLFKGPDVLDLQVRSTCYMNGSLIIRGRDHDEYNYLLVLTRCPFAFIVGYMKGSEAKAMTDCFNKQDNDKAPAWFIPQDRLHDPRELKGQLNANAK